MICLDRGEALSLHLNSRFPTLQALYIPTMVQLQTPHSAEHLTPAVSKFRFYIHICYPNFYTAKVQGLRVRPWFSYTCGVGLWITLSYSSFGMNLPIIFLYVHFQHNFFKCSLFILPFTSRYEIIVITQLFLLLIYAHLDLLPHLYPLWFNHVLPSKSLASLGTTFLLHFRATSDGHNIVRHVS